MDRIKGWFVRSPQAQQQTHTAPAVDLNLADAPSSSGADASEAVMQATAAAVAAGNLATSPVTGTVSAAVAAAAAAGADQQAAASSSSSTGSDAADAAGSSSEPSTSQQEEPQNVNPMLQTALTKRFQGRFEPLQMPTYESMMQEDFMNNCAVRSVIAGGMGGMLGVAFGVFTASLDTQGIDAAPMGETKPTRVVLRETWQLMKEKSRSYAKGFAGMGFLYSGTECMIERYRAKHDSMNATLAGCATGGLMAAPGGAKAMCFGCASFAAFSTAIEYFTGGM